MVRCLLLLNHMTYFDQILHTVEKLCKTAALKKTKNWFQDQKYGKMLQNFACLYILKKLNLQL